MFWAGAKKGNFDSKHAYSIATGSFVDMSSFSGSWVWKLDNFPRIKTFIWQCLHNSIRVGECLVKRCLRDSATCPSCQRESESILHRLRDCEAARLTWWQMGIHESSNFYEGNLNLGCTDAAPKRAHPRPTRRDAAMQEGRRRPRVRAASCRVVPHGKSRIGPTRRKSAPTRPKSG